MFILAVKNIFNVRPIEMNKLITATFEHSFCLFVRHHRCCIFVDIVERSTNKLKYSRHEIKFYLVLLETSAFVVTDKATCG